MDCQEISVEQLAKLVGKAAANRDENVLLYLFDLPLVLDHLAATGLNSCARCGHDVRPWFTVGRLVTANMGPLSEFMPELDLIPTLCDHCRAVAFIAPPPGASLRWSLVRLASDGSSTLFRSPPLAPDQR